jgi:hypothetical protein
MVFNARYNIMCLPICQWFATGRWFSPGTLVSSTNKTDRHDITEMLLKVALNTIKQTKTSITCVISEKKIFEISARNICYMIL